MTSVLRLREFGEQAREEIIAGADHRHVQRSAGNSLEPRHRVVGFAELLEDRAAVMKHFVAGRRQIDLLAELLEKRQSRVLLQLLDLRGDGRLGEVELFRGARKAEAARDGFEDFQLPAASHCAS